MVKFFKRMKRFNDITHTNFVEPCPQAFLNIKPVNDVLVSKFLKFQMKNALQILYESLLTSDIILATTVYIVCMYVCRYIKKKENILI